MGLPLFPAQERPVRSDFYLSLFHPLYIAFYLASAAPLYKCRDTVSRYRMVITVCLGTAAWYKDYLDLVLLARYPKLHQTVNLVPSLILQLEDYIAGTAFDPYLKSA